MKLNRHRATLLVLTMLLVGGDALAQTRARKFDEFTVGLGSPVPRWLRSYEEQREEFEARVARYARQLRKEKARAHIIGYSQRVLAWEWHDRSVGEMRAGQAKSELSRHGFEEEGIVALDGGFRETAATELWIVPRGAQPPAPTPTVQAEDIRYGKGSPTRREFALGCMGG